MGGFGDRHHPFKKGKKKNKGKKVKGALDPSQTNKVKADQTDARCSTVRSEDSGRETILFTKHP